jgi:hypothetical protein
MTNLSRLRKKLLDAEAATDAGTADEIDIVGCATIAYSSEPVFPVRAGTVSRPPPACGRSYVSATSHARAGSCTSAMGSVRVRSNYPQSFVSVRKIPSLNSDLRRLACASFPVPTPSFVAGDYARLKGRGRRETDNKGPPA